MRNRRSADPPLPFEEAGSGVPVIFLAGRLHDTRLWAPVAGLLANRYRSIRCDMRSDYHASTADRTERLVALMDWLDIDRAHLVAYGTGWPWAAGLAARAPGRAASLTVVDPVVPRTEQSPSMQGNWHLEMLLQWLSVSHGNVVRKPEHTAVLASVVAQQTHARMAEASEPAPAPIYASQDLPPLEGICCPVLALVGQGASTEAKTLVSAVFGQLPSCQIQPVQGAERHSPAEAPHTVADLLQSFLAVRG